MDGAHVDEDQWLSEDGTYGSLRNERRRKRAPRSTSLSLYKGVEGESSDVLEEQVEKKPKTENNVDGNLRSKPDGKQAKDNSHNAEAQKENYIHVRARRGQATNSHSLAERVRRENISERMKLLQELVPGCNKFLSMKFATVNPELNIDIDCILANDCSNGLSSSHPFPSMSFQIPGTTLCSSSKFPQFPTLPQVVLDNGILSHFQRGIRFQSFY